MDHRDQSQDGTSSDPSDHGRHRDKLTEEQRRERARAHVGHIVEALRGDDVWWYGEDDDGNRSDDPADFLYLYRRSHLLVRDEDVDRVRRLVDGDPEEGLVDGVTSIALPGGTDTPEALDRLDRELGVGVATPDTVLHVTKVGSCCPATEPDVVRAESEPFPPVDTTSRTLGRGVMVSVVDTGWHPPAVEWAEWLRGVTGDPETIDRHDIHPYAGHGTFIAGVVRCVAPGAEVRVEGFLPTGGAVLESKIVTQLLQAVQLGPDVISLSAGATTRKDRPLLSFEVFWEKHLSRLKGTVLVAAAGNDATRVPFWPAAFPWTLSVGALDRNENRAEFSNFGSWVDVYASGVDLVNAFPYGRFVCKEPPNTGDVRDFEGMARWSGTSFSTPLVAGLIAARMSWTGETARQAADALLARALTQAIPGIGSVLRPGDHR
ncbi:MAG TPA: S8/S53 family peptidase [Marmoricola sp.]|nr:S8/S53 family peptidase [Marmoricola sp.]